jgi:hypothetical protein
MAALSRMQRVSSWLRKWRGTIGAGFSLLWVSGFLFFTFRNGVPALEPNAWGDWAAGLAAPLAFLWLVIGYLQQGEELRANVDALKQQAAELRNSVAQQTTLSAASARQADLVEKSLEIAKQSADAAVNASRPWLAITSGEPHGIKFNANGAEVSLAFSIRNAGSTPAVRCELWVVAVPCGSDAIIAARKAVRLVQEIAEAFKGNPAGSILLPNESDIIHYGTGVEMADLEEAMRAAEGGKLHSFQVAALVDYTFSNGGRGRTEQLFNLRRVNSANQNVPLDTSRDETRERGLRLTATSFHRVMR